MIPVLIIHHGGKPGGNHKIIAVVGELAIFFCFILFRVSRSKFNQVIYIQQKAVTWRKIGSIRNKCIRVRPNNTIFHAITIIPDDRDSKIINTKIHNCVIENTQLN